MEPLPELERLISWIESKDREPLALVTDAVIISGRLGELGDDLIDHFVRQARRAGASWADIGSAIGVSKQAAQKRFVGRGPGFRGPSRGLFTRFGSGARSVVMNAVECAHELGASEIGTLHLVVGLAEAKTGRARQLMDDVTGDAASIGEAARTTLGQKSSGEPDGGHIPFASDSKKVLELALREAIHADSRHIGPEHVLLGILRDEGSPGARLLIDLGVSREGVLAWVEAHSVSDQ